jgi:MarR-like DNA-binding transcriptional regulator SgrR of sgrS sRNA
MSSAALEKHYRVRELAALWGFSDNTIIRMFDCEAGVVRLESGAGRRKYTTLSIPESVALRVHERLSQESLQAQLSAGNPVRVIRLRDLDAGVAKKPRNVLKLKSGEEHRNGERVSKAMRPAVLNSASGA